MNDLSAMRVVMTDVQPFAASLPVGGEIYHLPNPKIWMQAAHASGLPATTHPFVETAAGSELALQGGGQALAANGRAVGAARAKSRAQVLQD
jgi:hypothetical protein